VLGLDGGGHIGRFADYAQWEAWVEEQGIGNRDQGLAPTPDKSGRTVPSTSSTAKKKLSYLEAREFAAIEQRVEDSDARLAAAKQRVEDPAIATDAASLQQALAELNQARHENDALYTRWAELTEKGG